jgi:hypothetical protein
MIEIFEPGGIRYLTVVAQTPDGWYVHLRSVETLACGLHSPALGLPFRAVTFGVSRNNNSREVDGSE